MKKLKAYLKHFTPPILEPDNFKEYLDYKNNLSIISSQEGINFISDK